MTARHASHYMADTIPVNPRGGEEGQELLMQPTGKPRHRLPMPNSWRYPNTFSKWIASMTDENGQQ